MSQSALLDQMEIEIRDLLELVRERFQKADPAQLSRKPSPESWNALECFAHLNVYCDYYFPLIEKAIHKAKARRWSPAGEATSNWYGSMALKAVDPANLGRKRKKSPKKFNFAGKNVPPTTVKAFLINYEMLLRLIRHAREVDLNKAKVPSIRFGFLKFRLGDLIQYLVLHAKRHVIQASKGF